MFLFSAILPKGLNFCHSSFAFLDDKTPSKMGKYFTPTWLQGPNSSLKEWSPIYKEAKVKRKSFLT